MHSVWQADTAVAPSTHLQQAPSAAGSKACRRPAVFAGDFLSVRVSTENTETTSSVTAAASSSIFCYLIVGIDERRLN